MMLRNLLPFLAVLPASIYSLLTLWCGRSFFTDKKGKITGKIDTTIPVTIMKPVKGMDEGSYENFASFCLQKYDGSVQLLFALSDPDDPALPVIYRLIKDFPDKDINISINCKIHGTNYKISNLINAFPLVKNDIIIICDSDIRVENSFLNSVVSHFSGSEVGLVTSPYRTSKVHGVSTAFEALGFTTEMIPNVVTALKLEGLSFALGAAMTFRRQALEDIGGLEALVDFLADDYQLGNRIYHAGWKLLLDDQFVESVLKPETLSGILSRQLRWARTMRVSRPGGYLASGITLPGLGILAAMIAGNIPAALTSITFLYLIRFSVATFFSQRYVEDKLLPAWLWLLPFRDLLAFSSWLLAFAGNSVTWRGERFEVMPSGKLQKK